MPTSIRSQLRWPFRLLVAFAAIFLALEIVARLYCFGWDAFSYRTVESFHDIGRAGLLRLSSDPDLHVELEPNLDTIFKLTRFTTNSRGFRDREHSVSKPPQTFRIVMLGASYVMGSGVDLRDTVHSALERRLAESHPGVAYEVISMAVAGYSPWQSATLLEKQSLDYQPDLILFGTSPGQFETRRVPAQPLRSVSHPFFDSYFVRLLDARLRTAWRYLRGGERTPDPAKLEQTRRNMDEIFLRLDRVQRATGIPICVVALEHTNTRLNLVTEMETTAQRYDLPLIDATAPFVRAGFPNACAHPLDCHPNAWAHRVFADAITDFLVSRHLVDVPAGTARRDP